MEFFKSKKFEVVDVTSQDFVELEALNTLSFYIKDVFSGTAITTVDYLMMTSSGRDESIIGSYVNISNVTGDIYTFSFTPSGIDVNKTIKFRFKITSLLDGDEFFLYSDSYKVVGT